MLKLTAIVSLMLIATWSQADSRRHKRDSSSREDFDAGSTLWAASLSCDSCGSECASACGTRQFRSCCFNYLRKKRGPDAMKLWNPQDMKENQHQRLPMYILKSAPEPWFANFPSNDFKPYPFEDTLDNNHLQIVYDA